jgi:hypothetical protein
MNIVERVKNILLKPKDEWTVISQETNTTIQVFTSYLLVLALIPALCQLIRYGFIGHNDSFYGHISGSLSAGIRYAVIVYLTTILGAYVSALIIDALAANFGSQKDFNKSLQLVAYSYTPMMIAGVFYLIPGLSALTIVGLYGLYILYLGIKPMMLTPDDKVISYFVVSLLVNISIYAVLAMILSAILLVGSIARDGFYM